MDASIIEQLVRDVIGQLEQDQAAGAAPVIADGAARAVKPVAPTPVSQMASSTDQTKGSSDETLPDLGSDDIKLHIGVRHPAKPEVLQSLRGATRSRVCVGRAGTRPRTLSLLRFLADHSRSKDTVLSQIPPQWVQQAGLLELHTQVDEINQYLTRPDLGRVLSEDGARALRERCVQAPDVQIVVSDGLSTEAITANFDEILPPLTRYLQGAGLSLGTPLFVRFGRVKVEDQIGHLLQAKVVILLIGERPGLGQSESLSCYLVHRPTPTTVEADRTCISNIHRGGTPPVEAAAAIADLAATMIRLQASGIALTQRLQGAAS